jgi:hypothetical protein
MSDVFVTTGAARRWWGMAMLAISVMVLAVTTQVGPATAQVTPPPPTLTKTLIVAGDSVGVTGSGCVAATQVEVQLDGLTLVTATSTSSGTYSALLVVPKSVTPGAHPVTVVCAGPNGTVITANATITVSTTATTGYSLRPPIVVGGLLLMLGGVCLVATFRRRSRSGMARS